jgi:hypothetical protein
MMMLTTRNYWIYGLYPSSRILNNYKTTFRQLNLFPSSGEERVTPTSLPPLKIANLSPVIEVRDPTEPVSPSHYLNMETDPVSETLFPGHFKYS